MTTERPPLIVPPPPGAGSLTEQAARGAQWVFTGAGATAVLHLVFGIVLARLLTPADFGVVALAYVILGAARPLCDLGIGNAVVQRAALTDRHVRVAFTFSVLLGLTISTALVAAAVPLGTVIARHPGVAPVLRLLAAEFAIGGTTVVAGALLRRHLDFRRIAAIETVTTAIGNGAVAIGLALMGYGVWSLVWGALVHALLASISYLVTSPHPYRPLLAVRELRDLLHFGVGASVSGLLNHAAMHADNFVVGRWLGAPALGIYNRAYNLMNTPNTFSAGWIASVLFPAFAQAQSDPARVGRAYLSITQLTAMMAAPGMVALAIAAPHLLLALYGPQWLAAAAPLQILCAAGYFRALHHLGGIVAQSVGRVYAEVRRQAAYAVLVGVGAVAGARYGLVGVAVAADVAIVFMFVALGHLALSASDLTWRIYLRAQIPALVTAVLVCAFALPVRILLEARGARSDVIAAGIAAAAALPWLAGALWQIGEPRFERIRARIPRFAAAAAVTFRRRVVPARR